MLIEKNIHNYNIAIRLAKELIRRFEGLKLISYYCPAGIKTIGYGHTIQSNEQIGEQITLAMAEELLEMDILKAQNSLYKYCKVFLNQNQEAALISFIFNCGVGAFQRSTLLLKLNKGEYESAAKEFARWESKFLPKVLKS